MRGSLIAGIARLVEAACAYLPARVHRRYSISVLETIAALSDMCQVGAGWFVFAELGKPDPYMPSINHGYECNAGDNSLRLNCGL